MPQFHVCKLSPDPVDHQRDGMMVMDRKETIKTFTTDQNVAIAAAKDLAMKNPGVQYAVFGIVSIFETTKPTYVEKVVNDAGEIVIKPAAPVA